MHIVMLPVGKYDKEEAEYLDNNQYTSEEELRELYPEILIYAVPDFVDAVNDQSLEVLTEDWLAYVWI